MRKKIALLAPTLLMSFVLDASTAKKPTVPSHQTTGTMPKPVTPKPIEAPEAPVALTKADNFNDWLASWRDVKQWHQNKTVAPEARSKNLSLQVAAVENFAMKPHEKVRALLEIAEQFKTVEASKITGEQKTALKNALEKALNSEFTKPAVLELDITQLSPAELGEKYHAYYTELSDSLKQYERIFGGQGNGTLPVLDTSLQKLINSRLTRIDSFLKQYKREVNPLFALFKKGGSDAQLAELKKAIKDGRLPALPEDLLQLFENRFDAAKNNQDVRAAMAELRFLDNMLKKLDFVAEIKNLGNKDELDPRVEQLAANIGAQLRAKMSGEDYLVLLASDIDKHAKVANNLAGEIAQFEALNEILEEIAFAKMYEDRDAQGKSVRFISRETLLPVEEKLAKILQDQITRLFESEHPDGKRSRARVKEVLDLQKTPATLPARLKVFALEAQEAAGGQGALKTAREAQALIDTVAQELSYGSMSVTNQEQFDSYKEQLKKQTAALRSILDALDKQSPRGISDELVKIQKDLRLRVVSNEAYLKKLKFESMKPIASSDFDRVYGLYKLAPHDRVDALRRIYKDLENNVGGKRLNTTNLEVMLELYKNPAYREELLSFPGGKEMLQLVFFEYERLLGTESQMLAGVSASEIDELRSAYRMAAGVAMPAEFIAGNKEKAALTFGKWLIGVGQKLARGVQWKAAQVSNTGIFGGGSSLGGLVSVLKGDFSAARLVSQVAKTVSDSLVVDATPDELQKIKDAINNSLRDSEKLSIYEKAGLAATKLKKDVENTVGGFFARVEKQLLAMVKDLRTYAKEGKEALTVSQAEREYNAAWSEYLKALGLSPAQRKNYSPEEITYQLMLKKTEIDNLKTEDRRKEATKKLADLYDRVQVSSVRLLKTYEDYSLSAVELLVRAVKEYPWVQEFGISNLNVKTITSVDTAITQGQLALQETKKILQGKADDPQKGQSFKLMLADIGLSPEAEVINKILLTQIDEGIAFVKGARKAFNDTIKIAVEEREKELIKSDKKKNVTQIKITDEGDTGSIRKLSEATRKNWEEAKKQRQEAIVTAAEPVAAQEQQQVAEAPVVEQERV